MVHFLCCYQELSKTECKFVTVSLLFELAARQKQAQCRSYCEIKLVNGEVVNLAATNRKIAQLSFAVELMRVMGNTSAAIKNKKYIHHSKMVFLGEVTALVVSLKILMQN